ncbi:hypothetical protein [Prescottella equi]|uniref:hypothetical protein n=1 Tax=Rhodococcus hoagii TaxID=43767 RepID=UPI0019F53336|nr:hypothetical protein [Prescottella equi]MBM4592362.1 hypothetical protein [Prescottella equi]MBM4608093.1 hypothetical protein [Prescottella equi]MBM4657396.1 hypothetical protein [Prescottella equi]MBM4720226.1 hypothetical protein [Prescottella equi]MBM4720292.1 hypothetical protein [Prescottella equi]
MSEASDTGIARCVHTIDELQAAVSRARHLAEHWVARSDPVIRECGLTLLNRLDGPT